MLKEDEAEDREDLKTYTDSKRVPPPQEEERGPPSVETVQPQPTAQSQQPAVVSQHTIRTPQQSRTTTGVPHNKRSQSSTNPFQMHSKISVIPANRQGQLNTQFLATLPGALKLGEIILGFVSFILAICADRRSTSAAWTEHISFETTIVVTAILIGYVVFPHLTIANEQTRNGLVVVELLFYGLNALFYFIGIWLMVHLSASWTAEGRGAAIMDAILCVALCVLYAVETFLKFKSWRGDEDTSANVKRSPHPTIPPPPTHRPYDSPPEDSNKDHAIPV
ncbi:hypothetical protein DdX_04689 [Ditylenchus destructor]|uniref:MARVEL domain-containing protein n=1 Tax=Ditylenchus destructor TaxID=166010 RepID=A0AAD4R700_9BILA|nr:hypothetical protein DdX_04689 [Ditylenchus destructor]